MWPKEVMPELPMKIYMPITTTSRISISIRVSSSSRSSTRLLPTPTATTIRIKTSNGQYFLTSATAAADIVLHPFPDGANLNQAVGAPEQNGHDERKHEGITERAQIRWQNGLQDDAQDTHGETADHGTQQTAEAADHRRNKSEQHQRHPHLQAEYTG